MVSDLLLELDSTGEEDALLSKPGRNRKQVACGSALLAAVVGCLLFVLTRGSTSSFLDRSSSSGDDSLLYESTCLGFDECPEYPMPYKNQKWPTTYELSGEFPEGFIWGLGTAAYQIEGGYNEGGRGASIWDTFVGANTIGMPGAACSYCCKQAPCPINPAMSVKGQTGNVACNHFHMFKSDVALMKSAGLKTYRFSVAWPRIVPTGRFADGVNQEGIVFYNELIDELIANDIEPVVTLYHWDLPQGLLDPPQVNGWYSTDQYGQPNGAIQDEFVAYANECFKHFGDRVKLWITFNEPYSFIWLASGYGKAPSIQAFSDMNYWPYIAAHNVLNAHAAVVDLYRKQYQQKQGGKIGMTNNQDWREPLTEDPADVAAAERAMQFQLGWFADPLYTGDYPPVMKKVVGNRLPSFTEEQKQLLKGSVDFFGLNHYGTGFVKFNNQPGQDLAHASVQEVDGAYVLPRGQSEWLYGAGWGFRKLLNWVKRRYSSPVIFVTEAGWSISADSVDESVHDLQRTAYYANYSSEMLRAIQEDGVNVKAFFGWSVMDNLEWQLAFSERFGMVFNDFAFGKDPNAPYNNEWQPTSNQVRTRKHSSCWYEVVGKKNAIVRPDDPDAACVTSAIFGGIYVEEQHDDKRWTIEVHEDGLSGSISSSEHGQLQVSFSHGTIIADFSAMQGPEHLLGYWNKATTSVNWGNGSSWHQVQAA